MGRQEVRYVCVFQLASAHRSGHGLRLQSALRLEDVAAAKRAYELLGGGGVRRLRGGGGALEDGQKGCEPIVAVRDIEFGVADGAVDNDVFQKNIEDFRQVVDGEQAEKHVKTVMVR